MRAKATQARYRVSYFELIGGTQHFKSALVTVPDSYEVTADFDWLRALRAMGIRANRAYQAFKLH